MIRPGIYENIMLCAAVVTPKKHLSVLFKDDKDNDQWITFFKVNNMFGDDPVPPDKIMKGLKGLMNQLGHILKAHGVEENWDGIEKGTKISKYNIQDYVGDPLVLQQINMNIFEKFLRKIRPLTEQTPQRVAFIKRSKNKDEPFFRKFYMDKTPFMAPMGSSSSSMVDYTDFERNANLVPLELNGTDNQDYLDDLPF